MTAIWVGFALAMIVAMAAFLLLLVLARRVRDVEERVAVFFPSTADGLPSVGTPVPDVSAASTDGKIVGRTELSGPNQILAFLTTECAVCREQVWVLRGVATAGWPRPVVTIAGPPDDRQEMVNALKECTIVIEEITGGPVATAFGVSDFPAILLAEDGVITTASHGMAAVLESRSPAA